MKKYIFSLCAVFAMCTGLYAQSEILEIKKVEKGKVPGAVTESLDRDFKNIIPQEVLLIPEKMYQQGYKVTYKDDLDGTTPEYYSVHLKGTNFTGEAIYDSSGNLLNSKEKISNESLPANIVEAVKDKYPNAVITKDHEIIRDSNKAVDHYKVYFKNNGKRGYALVDADGKMLHSEK